MSLNIQNLLPTIVAGHLTFGQVCEALAHEINTGFLLPESSTISAAAQSIIFHHLPQLLPGFFDTPEDKAIPAKLTEAIRPIDICRWIVILTKLEKSDDGFRNELIIDTSVILAEMADNLLPEEIAFILANLPSLTDEDSTIPVLDILTTLQPHLDLQTQLQHQLSHESIACSIYGLHKLPNCVQVENMILAILPHIKAYSIQGEFFNVNEIADILYGLNNKNFSPAIITLFPYLVLHIDAATGRGERFSEAMIVKTIYGLAEMRANESATDEETLILFNEVKLAIDRNIKQTYKPSNRILKTLARITSEANYPTQTMFSLPELN